MKQSYHRRTSSLESGRSLDRRIRKGLFDVDLTNMADATVVSSYDDQSNFVVSSAISLPPDVHEERKQKLKQLKQQQEQEPPSSDRSAAQREEQHSQSESDSDSHHSASSPKESLQKPPSITDPLKHYSLVVLSNIFFLIGSTLFIAASWLEFHEISNNHRSSTFLTRDREPEEDETPSGYHLKLSTSIDTYVTHQMIGMLGATFCYLQVGFINVVRTPWDKFHFFQILAGLSGLVSAMFWETKTILSDISYFFFSHAMTGQALSLLHSHWRRLVRPAMAQLKTERETATPQTQQQPNHRPQRRFTFSPLKQQQGHFAFESSHSLYENSNPSGLVSDDNEAAVEDEPYPTDDKSSSDGGYSFSVENSFSLEELDTVRDHAQEEGGDHIEVPPPTDDPSEDSQSDANSIKRTAENKVEGKKDKSEEAIMLQFGFLFCVADSIFVLGSLIETALTYLTILVLPLPSSNDEDENGGEIEWNAIARVFNLVPGILWLACALLTLVATLSLRRHRKASRTPKTKLKRPSIAVLE